MIMDATKAGAGEIVVDHSCLRRRPGAGWHMRPEREAGRPVVAGKIVNGLTIIWKRSVRRETVSHVGAAVRLVVLELRLTGI